MVLFKDLNKKSTDLLNQDFPFKKTWELQLDAKKGNPECAIQASFDPKTKYDASSEFKFKEKDFEAQIKINKVQRSILNFTYKVPSTHFQLGLSAKQNALAEIQNDTAFIAEYKNDDIAHAKCILDLQKYDISAACKSHFVKKLTLGASIGSNSYLEKPFGSVGALYKMSDSLSDWEFYLSLIHGPKADNIIHANAHRSAKPHSCLREVGVEVVHDLNSESKGTQVAFGGKWEISADPCTNLKAKLCHDGKLSLAFTHKLTPAISTTFGSQADLTDLSSPLIYGVKVKLDCDAKSTSLAK